MGEQGAKCMLSGAVSVCTPFNNVKNLDNLNKSLFGIYNNAIGKCMVERILEHEKILSSNEKYLGMTLQEACSKVKTVYDFDENITSKLMPTPQIPYNTAKQYYISACP